MPSMSDVATALHGVLTTTADESAQQTGFIQRHRTAQHPKRARASRPIVRR
ncbi:MAG TPA: hypothetical protein VFS96_01780 [Nitrolancea sp.]|nr:hypothetical protein [Nitrolancea sp.]